MTVQILQGDCLEVLRTLPAASVNCCVTSPPYWGLRDYSICGCSQKRHASQAALEMCRTIAPGASGQSSATDPRCRKEPDAGCPLCGGTGVIEEGKSQIGLERTPDEYVAKLVEVFDAARRAIRDDGTVWLNLGDTYVGGGRGGNPDESAFRKQATNRGSLVERTPIPAGLKAKDLTGIPWRVALALQADGWYLRQDIIWSKPNPMPESVKDRCTKAHEYIFLLSKSERYYFNQEAIAEPASYAGCDRGGSTNRYEQNDSGMDNRQYDTRNKRSVWSVQPRPYKAAHFATFPPDLIKPCILAGCPEGGTVLDPFLGSGTTALVAQRNGCNCIGIDLNPEYIKLAKRRLRQSVLNFTE